MTRNVASVSDAESVMDALMVLDDKGIAGLNAAIRENPKVAEHLRKKVLAILDPGGASSGGLAKIELRDNSESPPLSTNHLSNALSDPASNTRLKRGSEHRPIPLAGTKARSATRKLIDDFGSRPATYMTRFVIMQHLSNHTRNTSVKTILDELVHAELMGHEQRPSLVTSLNRLKKKNKLITWPEAERGEQITLTPEGNTYLSELISKKLQPDEIAYLREHASASISAHLPQ
jgi:hypothetical protein